MGLLTKEKIMKRIGIVGFSGGKYNVKVAEALLELAIKLVEEYESKEGKDVSLVSGLTDMGIPGMAYRIAQKKGWKTVGIACEKAHENPCFPVDEEIIVGKEWGDESETFLDSIDVVIRVGGGAQSFEEVKKAKDKGIKAYEYDLPRDAK